jgi:hypothetical protein
MLIGPLQWQLGVAETNVTDDDVAEEGTTKWRNGS